MSDFFLCEEFFLCEIENIEELGVEIKVTGTRLKKDDDDCIRTVRTVCFDFSEHDKVFEDKITKLEENVGYYKDSVSRVEKNCDKLYHENKELKQRIADLESKDSVKPMRIEFYADNGEPFTPLEVANSLINQNAFKVDELRELAEHLQVYCRHHNDKDTETISF